MKKTRGYEKILCIIMINLKFYIGDVRDYNSIELEPFINDHCAFMRTKASTSCTGDPMEALRQM